MISSAISIAMFSVGATNLSLDGLFSGWTVVGKVHNICWEDGINLGFVGLPYQQLAHHPEVFLGLPIDLTSQHLAFGKLDGDGFFVHAWCHQRSSSCAIRISTPLASLSSRILAILGWMMVAPATGATPLQPASLSQVRAHWRMAAPLLSSVWTSLT